MPRAIIPSSVLLPTPLPPNKPILCPRPQVRSPSIAVTPVPSGVVIDARDSGFSAEGRSGKSSVVVSGPRSSSGRPRPSTTRPNSASPTGTEPVLPPVTTMSPG